MDKVFETVMGDFSRIELSVSLLVQVKVLFACASALTAQCKMAWTV